MTVYAKDTAQVADDFRIYVQNVTDNSAIYQVDHTLTAAYDPLTFEFNVDSDDANDECRVWFWKMTATANTISVDYFELEYLSSDFGYPVQTMAFRL